MSIFTTIVSVAETARRTLKSRVAFLTVCLCFLIGAITAQTAGAEEYVSDDWQFQVAPYAWGLSAEGDVTVKGNKAEVDLSLGDILEDLNLAAMFEAEARKNRLGLFINPFYAQLEDDTNRVDVTLDIFIGSFGGYYRLGPWSLDSEAGTSGPVLVTDIYAGGRYNYLGVEVEGNVLGILDVDKDQEWLDPIIGVRTLWFLTPKWVINILGDVGGFGAGSDFQWMASGMLGYGVNMLGDDNARVFAGYRAIGWDYSDGSGADKFAWKMTFHGPLVGLAYHF
jgi:hypothetical protein